MTRISTITLAGLLLSSSAGMAVAQATTVFTGVDSAGNQVEALENQVADDFEKTARPGFGNDSRPLGFYGSVSASGTMTSGNTDTTDLGIGARLGTFDGINGHDVVLSFTYGESAGVRSANQANLGYDYTRTLNGALYGFGQLRYAYDEFGSYETDAFVGAGLGYRLIDTANVRWQVQGGPGYRRLKDSAGTEVSEGAFSLTSKYFNAISQTAAITNDTDILYSETDTAVTNDLGITMAVSDKLALRTSLLTEYHSDPLPGKKSTDNAIGVSLVYNLN